MDELLDALAFTAFHNPDAAAVFLDALEESGVECPPYVRNLDEVFFATSRDYHHRVDLHRSKFALQIARERIERQFKEHWSTAPWRGPERGVLELPPLGSGQHCIAAWPTVHLAPHEQLTLRVVGHDAIAPHRFAATDEESRLFMTLSIYAEEHQLEWLWRIENATDEPIALRSLTVRYST